MTTALAQLGSLAHSVSQPLKEFLGLSGFVGCAVIMALRELALSDHEQAELNSTVCPCCQKRKLVGELCKECTEAVDEVPY